MIKSKFNLRVTLVRINLLAMGPVLQCLPGRQVPIEDLPEGFRKGPGDIMMVVKHYMADTTVQQVFCVAPESRILLLQDTMGIQPAGIAQRRPVRSEVKRNIETEVPQLLSRRFISTAAAHYLLNYGRGTLPLPARPSAYKFL